MKGLLFWKSLDEMRKLAVHLGINLMCPHTEQNTHPILEEQFELTFLSLDISFSISTSFQIAVKFGIINVHKRVNSLHFDILSAFLY